MLGSHVQFLTSHLQCLHATRRGFCMGREERPENLQKGTDCRLSVSSVHQCVLCLVRRWTTRSLRWTAWYPRSMCTNTTKTSGGAETHTSECRVLRPPPPAPMGKLIPAPCVSQLACFQKTVQPSHRNHACSSAPGGLRPIGLPSTSENQCYSRVFPPPTPGHAP